MSKANLIENMIGIVFLVVVIYGTIKWFDTMPPPQEQVVVPCEQHEYVITSKYNWFLDKYKTISKCTKCGKEV